MRVVLITGSYPPEIGSAAHLLKELADELTLRGHNVTVFTVRPRYNLLDEPEIPKGSTRSVENGVEVVRVWTPPIHKVNFISRGLAHFSLPTLFKHSLAHYFKEAPQSKPEAVFVYSPPITLAGVGAWAKHRYGARLILNVQDIFPQNAIDLRVLRNKILIRVLESVEVRGYETADAIVVHSDGNRRFLIDHKHQPEGKLSVIHNWIDVNLFAGAPGTGRFRRQWGLEGRFILLFGGVVGPSQGLDIIIKLAHALKAIDDVCFLIVGDGMEKNRLEGEARKLGLRNVVFKPFVSGADYPELVKEADVGILSLTSLNKTPVVPSKILGYMAGSIPVLAFINAESDAHQIIRESGCGLSAVHDDWESALQVAKTMVTQRSDHKVYGENGYRFALEHFDKQPCVDGLERLMDKDLAVSN